MLPLQDARKSARYHLNSAYCGTHAFLNAKATPGLHSHPSPGMLKADLPQRFTGAFTNRSLSEIRTPRTPACHSNGMILAQAAGFVNTCCAKYFVLFTRAEP